MLPLPHQLPVSQLLARCDQHVRESLPDLSETRVRAKKILVRDVFEIVDHAQPIGDCFTDFMEVTVMAFPKKSARPVESPSVKVPKPVTEAGGKHFSSKPSTMEDFKRSLKQNLPPLREDNKISKRQKVDAESDQKASPSKDASKETKNARKRRERKALEKLQKSTPSRPKESLSSSSDEQNPCSQPSSGKSFIDSIKESFEKYSIESASEKESSDSDSQVEKPTQGARLSLSSDSSSSFQIQKKPVPA